MEEKNNPLFIAFQQGYARRNSFNFGRDWEEFKKEHTLLFKVTGGPVWVNCSERMPEPQDVKLLAVKWHQGVPSHYCVGALTANQLADRVKQNVGFVYEWLDETGTAALNGEQDAHEKEVMMRAFHNVKQIFEGRKWIMEGRGCYPYDDDRYKEEVRYMYDEFDQVFNDTWANIKSKSVEYREWIIKVYLKNDHPAIHDILKRLGYRKEKESEVKSDNSEQDAVEFAEWMWGYCKEYQRGGTYVTIQDEVLTITELYKLFKQQP